MVNFGCCLPIGSFVPQMDDKETDVLEGFKKGFSILENNGFDFAELTVGSVADLSSDEFEEVKKLLADYSISVPAFNCFIPGNIPLTGEEVSYEKIEEYLQLVMKRMGEMGGKYVVFGSGSARKVPEGFSRNKAIIQLENFLKMCNKYGKKHDIIIAIEHLNKKETNIINSVKEGYELAKKINLPHIKVLADSYHMFEESESFDILEEVNNDLVHVHIADKDRKYPGEIVDQGVDFEKFFKTLKSIGYDENISLECSFSDFEEDSKNSLDYIRKVYNNK